jgi:ubiquitin carboxyl-terminal hydrolase 47
LIHTGGAFGGHYFAYIRSSTNKKWYNFNDSNVTLISDEEISKTFGGESMPNTAYMLLYRKID